MDFLHVKKASIVGWIDGGIMGLLLATHHPERVSKLFTFGANYNSSGYKRVPSDTSTATLFMLRAADNYRRLSLTPNNFYELRKALGKLYSNESNLTAAELNMIKAPTVISFGEYEQFIKREHFEEMAKLIPNAQLVMLPNVSHEGPLQDPTHFHEAVMRLLKGRNN